MVSNGDVQTIIVKAKYGADIRKTQLLHNKDLSYNDLLLMTQRLFDIQPSTSILLKYRDSDGDFITLTGDNDLLLALGSEQLYVEVFTDGEDIQSQITQLDQLFTNVKTSVEHLKKALKGQVVQSLIAGKARNASRTASPVTHDSGFVATIHPSVHEQVDNGQISKPNDLTSEKDNSGLESNIQSAPLENIPIDQLSPISKPAEETETKTLEDDVYLRHNQQQSQQQQQQQHYGENENIYGAQAPPTSQPSYNVHTPQPHYPPPQSQYQPPTSQYAPPPNQPSSQPPQQQQQQYGGFGQAEPPRSQPYTPTGVQQQPPPPQSYQQPQGQNMYPPTSRPQGMPQPQQFRMGPPPPIGPGGIPSSQQQSGIPPQPVAPQPYYAASQAPPSQPTQTQAPMHTPQPGAPPAAFATQFGGPGGLPPPPVVSSYQGAGAGGINPFARGPPSQASYARPNFTN
jgi:hypothetical protein